MKQCFNTLETTSKKYLNLSTLSILELSKENKDSVSLSPPTGRQHYNYQFSDLDYSKCLRLHCSVEELSSPEEEPGPINLVEVQGW